MANRTPCESADVCEGGQCVAEGCGSGPACVSPRVCIEEACVVPVCGNGGPCRVFVALDPLIGSEIGGLIAADAHCQSAADAASLEGTFMAWLAAGFPAPANRFTNRDQAGPYQLPPNDTDGNNPPPAVSPDFATLTSCVGGGTPCLLNPINRTADGNTVVVNDFPVWTGTIESGVGSSSNCGGWTGAGSGLRGNSSAADVTWTNVGPATDCTEGALLYCFEQA